MFKKIRYVVGFGVGLMLLSGCTAMVKSSLGKGKEYKFTDDEGGVQTYYCKEVSTSTLSMDRRAKKSFEYFNKKNKENSIQLLKDLMDDKTTTLQTAMSLNKNAEHLAKEILAKYDCVLLEYKE